MSKLIADEALREQIEEFALHMKPGTTKGKHRTAIFDTLELAKLVQHLIAQAQRQLLAELLEQLPRPVKNWDESFCITCEAFLEDDNYQCYCDLRNELLDQVVSIIEHYLTKAEP